MGAGSSDLYISLPDSDPRARPIINAEAGALMAQQPPNLGDYEIRKSMKSKLATAGMGRSSTFLTGPLGSPATAGGVPTLLGGPPQPKTLLGG